jgi:diguanylate cyclase (GGDEF)-like protein
LTAQVLRIVNSPLFGLRRQVTSLDQAAAYLGISGVRTVSLGFSLSKGLLRSAWRDIRGELLWKRSVLAAAVAREIADAANVVQKEEAFLGALLQDIGILALRELLGAEYEALLAEKGQDHLQLVSAENELLGDSHAEVGAWLLRHWGLPEIFSQLALASHGELSDNGDDEAMPLYDCVALSGPLAEAWIAPRQSESNESRVAEIRDRLGIEEQNFEKALGRVVEALPELLRIFEIEFATSDFESLLDRARQSAFSTSLSYMMQTREKDEALLSLSAEVVRLREDARRDGLTGVYNRQFFEDVLEDNFRRVAETGLQLSLCFCDLDDFKQVNDLFGHLEGDKVLRRTAEILSSELRRGDFVCRFGGDEFVVLLLDCSSENTREIANRIRFRIAGEFPGSSDNSAVRLTVSIGYAVQTRAEPFRDIRAFINAADQASYEAKLGGKNCVVRHREALPS